MAVPAAGMDIWTIQPRERALYRDQFEALKPVGGIVTGEQAKGFLLRSQLPPPILGQIWGLSDTDADGKMDLNEFSIACKLIHLKLRGQEIPKSLPPTLIQSLKAIAASEAGMTNGSGALQNQGALGSLVNLGGAAPTQSLGSSSPRPLIGGIPGPVQPARPVPPMQIPLASRQCRQSVAGGTLATTNTTSKPPARPAPPCMGNMNSPAAPAGVPQRPAPPGNIGASFVATSGGPPPKPAPPSFPNSPVTGTASGAPVQAVQPISMASAIDLLDLEFSEGVQPIAPVAPIAPIAPLNTNPTPMAAFGMGQTIPGAVPMMQPFTGGVVPPMAAVPGVVPPIPSIPANNGMTAMGPLIGTTPVPLAQVIASNGNGGVAVQTPVSTCTPLSTTARPPSIDRVGSMDSQHSQHSVSSPQALDWAVPHQTKLKYTQLFNTWDRTRSGFLSGPQARNIMVQSQLSQAILAQIWGLSDMDSDGRLGCEEFVLAMHLCDMAKAGEPIPATLPLDLIPPTFRRQRQSSVSSQGLPETIDPLAGMPQSSFEDKRKENFEKGQAELERRRKTLHEIQRKEQDERERKEREEAEKQEKIRLEQERRRQAEIEKQMMKQREIEQEKEEQRKRAQEQREAARKEMERQRQLEWETQKSHELQAQRQKEQDILLKLKAKNQTLSIELGSLNDKVKELSQKICDTRVGVSGVKTTIDGMRSTRDTQLQEMAALKNKLREQNQRLLSLSQDKARIEAKNKINAAQDTAGQEAMRMAFANKQITLKQMKDKISDLQQQINDKMSDIENNNGQLDDVRNRMQNLGAECKQLYSAFDSKRLKILELRQAMDNAGPVDYANSAWTESAWGSSDVQETAAINDDSWPVDEAVIAPSTIDETANGVVKYRALYEFVARNDEEISFQPGDIILVPPVQNQEPGWMAGEIRGHTGWFPEAYVEPVDPGTGVAKTFSQQDSLEKRTLEGIAEVPENVSDAGSLGGEGPAVDVIVPTPGLGTACSIQATALYQYRPVNPQHLTFNKGDVVTVQEQQEEWCYGESAIGAKGWFPKSYVRLSGSGSAVATTTPTAVASTNGFDATAVSAASAPSADYYVALYQYASNEPDDLSFNEGDIISVTKKDGQWWTGTIGDRNGFFPSNYVEKCESSVNQVVQEVAFSNEISTVHAAPLTSTQTTPPVEKTAEQIEDERAAAEDRAELPDFTAMSSQQYYKARGRKPEIVQVIAPYQATSTEQLDLQRGQLIMIRKKTETGWWEGELQARGKKRQIGWFPASYVKPLTSSSNRSTPISHGYQDSPTDPNVERVMALYPHNAQNEDELSFEKGDVITVLAKEEEAWWRGEINGISGIFPSNYVTPMSSDLTNDFMMSRLEPMERKRQEYIKELIATEQAYIEDMRLVHEVFEKPLLQSLVLTVDEVDRIFVNWRDIIACNDNFLRTLRIRRDNSEGGIVRMIGDILCENIPRMSAYVRFCSCQISAAVYLQRLTETSPQFVAVAQACQQDHRTKGMPLSSFLIKPMQRITKYPLIINKILEHTSPDHPDWQYLQEALAKAEEFCIQVNEGVREKENSDRLEWLQTHVACDDGLEEQLVFNSLTNSAGPRKLLHYGVLHKAKSGKELVAFLTNDFLLFAQPLKSLPSGQQFSFERNEHQRFKLYRKPIFLNELSILGESEASGSGSANGHDCTDTTSRTLRLRDAKKPIILLAPSAGECSLWTKRITEARKQFAKYEKNLLQRQRSKQAQFGACGRILVTVLQGFNLKTPVTVVRRRPPKGCLHLVVVEAEDLVYAKKVTPAGTTSLERRTNSLLRRTAYNDMRAVSLGKCNAFCKVSMGSQEETTSVVSGSDCPLWDASMQFQVKDLLEDTLCITVFDKGYYSPDDFLGRAEVRVADIMRDSQDACGPIQKRITLREVERGEVVLKLDLRLFGSR